MESWCDRFDYSTTCYTNKVTPTLVMLAIYWSCAAVGVVKVIIRPGDDHPSYSAFEAVAVGQNFVSQYQKNEQDWYRVGPPSQSTLFKWRILSGLYLRGPTLGAPPCTYDHLPI